MQSEFWEQCKSCISEAYPNVSLSSHSKFWACVVLSGVSFSSICLMGQEYATSFCYLQFAKCLKCYLLLVPAFPCWPVTIWNIYEVFESSARHKQRSPCIQGLQKHDYSMVAVAVYLQTVNRENSIGKFLTGGLFYFYFLNLTLLCCNTDGSVSSYTEDRNREKKY